MKKYAKKFKTWRNILKIRHDMNWYVLNWTDFDYHDEISKKLLTMTKYGKNAYEILTMSKRRLQSDD